MNEKMSKTIAQQLNIKDFPFIIRDKDGNVLYCEWPDNFWTRYEYDSDGNEIYYENSDGRIIDYRTKKTITRVDEFIHKIDQLCREYGYEIWPTDNEKVKLVYIDGDGRDK